MSSAIHDMICLSSCKSLWGYPGLKMNILCGDMVLLNDKVSGGHKITYSLSIIIGYFMETVFATAGSQGVFTYFGVHISHNYPRIMFKDCLIDSF